MFITMIISLIAIVGVSLAAEEIMQSLSIFGLTDIPSLGIEVIVNAFETNFKAGISMLGIFAWGFLQIYGIPLIVFLVSIHGLTTK